MPGLARLVPVVVVVAAIGAAAVSVGAGNLGQAERDRLRNRAELVDTTAESQRDAQRSDVAQRTAESVPLSPGNDAGNRAMLGLLSSHGAYDATSAVVLIDRYGVTHGSVPEGASLDPGLLGPALGDALAGRAAWSPSFTFQGARSNAEVVPVGGEEPWAAVAIVRAAATSSAGAMLADMGALDGQPGGLSIVDPAGTVFQSWDPGLIGTTALAPAEVAALPVDTTTSWTTGSGGDETTQVGRRVPSGYAVIFAQRSDALYGDLRAAQRQRDLTMLAVLGFLTLALSGYQLARQRAARRAEERTHTLLERSQDLVLVAGRGGALTFVSPSIARLLGHPPTDWLRRPLAELAHADDRDRLARLLAEPTTGPLTDVRLARRQGGYRWFDLEADDHSTHGDIGGVLLTGHEVDERKQLEDELDYQATHDKLTGVANRVELARRLDELIVDGRVRRPFALLYLDLDQFKPINDELGHAAGDSVLTTVAARMTEAAGAASLVCRFGGDEFGILVPDADEPTVRAVARALLDAVRRPVAYSARLLHVDASIGVVLAARGPAATDAEDLIREADEAMYEAKRGGRGRYLIVRAVPPDGSGWGDGVVAAGGPDLAGTPADRPGDAGDDAAGPGPSGPPPGALTERSLSAGSTATTVDDRRPAGAADRGRRRGTPAPAAGLRARTARAAPLLVAIAVVVLVAGIGQRQTAESRRADEALRLDTAVTQTAHLGEFYSRFMDLQARTTAIDNVPWTLDGGPIDQRALDGMAQSTLVGPGSVVALYRPDGELLGVAPADQQPPDPTGWPAWQTALGGRADVVPGWTADGVTRLHQLMPIGRDGRTAAVLMLGLPQGGNTSRAVLTTVGRAGPVGDYSFVAGDGVSFLSWNPDLLGQQVADPAELTGIPSGGSRLLDRHDGSIAIAAPIPTWSETTPVHVVYTAPAALFYQDLRAGQGVRDATLVVVVLLGVAGLSVVHHRREQESRRNERRLDALLHGAHDVITVVDGTGRMAFVSSAVTALLGYGRDAVRGLPFLELAHPDDRDRIDAMLATARHGGAAGARDVRLRNRSGVDQWFDIETTDLSADGPGTVLLTCHEITRRRAVAERLVHQASHDPLTGLPNRASWTLRLEELTGDERPFAVLFIDLDHFKPVNDTYGHDAGDAVLRTVAARLRDSVRAGDDGDLICRLGGDEFAVVLRDATAEGAARTAERLIAAIRQPIAIGATTVTVGATIGVALSHPDGPPAVTVQHADTAMYRAKQAGRGRYDLYTD